MSDLRVELYGHPVGRLIGTDWRTFDFRTDRAAFEFFELGSTVLSESVPLLAESRSRAARRRNYFTELLPEGRTLTNLAAAIGVAEYDAVALLTHYGRDVAGALQIYDHEQPGEPRTPRTTPTTDHDVRELLLNTQAAPLGNAPVSGKTSLAGVQDKIVLARVGHGWMRVHDGYPSTHILKPDSKDHPTLIFDEEYGARAARALGLTSTATRVADFEDIAALVIERYDRSADGLTGRIHQEDMNQALGARGNEKYQEHGGKVSLRRVAEVFRKNGDTSSLERLLTQTVLTVTIGNVDMHAKNIGLLHHADGSAAIAPAYDMVPLRHQRNDGRMALSVNGIYPHAQITVLDIIREAEAWGISGPQASVDRALETIASFVETEQPDARVHPHLREDIRAFTRRLRAGKPAGDPGGA